MSDLGKTACEADELIDRMRTVRSAGYTHVNELQGEAKRLVDWKEYVLTKPLLSITAASLLGFALTRSTRSALPVSRQQPITGEPSKTISNQQPTFVEGAVRLASSVASSAIKNYFANLVQRIVAEKSPNDRLQEFNTRFKNVT